MAKYFRWNPDRSADGTYSGTVTKRFLKLDSKPNQPTATSSYYKVDEPSSGGSCLVLQNKSTNKPLIYGPMSSSDFASDMNKFTSNSTKRNHCLSDWVCMRSGSTRFTMPLGGYLWKQTSASTTLYQNSDGIPYGANKQANEGEIFFATEENSSTSKRTPLHCLRDGDTGNMVPKSLAGTQFGFYSSRYSGSTFTIYSLYDDCVVSYGETGNNSGGYENIFARPDENMGAGDMITKTISTNATRIFIQSTHDIIVSVNEVDGGDRMMVPPSSEYMYTRRATTKGEWLTGSNATHSNHMVVYSTNDGQKVWAVEIGDGSGGDSTMGLGIEFLANTFAYGGVLSDYAIIAPFGLTQVTIKYHGKTNGNTEAWTTLNTHNIGSNTDNSPIVPAGRFEDGDGNGGDSHSDYDDSGGGNVAHFANDADMWWFEADKPVYIVINTSSGDEESLLGWMRRSTRSDIWLEGVNDIKDYIITPDEDLFLVE